MNADKLDLIGIRRELHRIPELAFEEHRTSEELLDVITALTAGRDDITITRHRTGLIVRVPSVTSGPVPPRTVGWRADMDALPMPEETGLPYSSEHPGAMHACGHDIHMAVALGVLAQVLARPQRNHVVFFFQPAEENISGAQEIYDAGLLDGIDELYALHVSPEWDAGIIATQPGPFLAGSSSVTVEFTGVPGHAGMPHRAVDPIPAVAAFVLQIQAMIARDFDPATGGVVLTFGTISGGTVVNAVAPSAKVMGTLRFLSDEQQDLAFQRIREIADGIATATRTKATVELSESPWVPTVNDPGITAKFIEYMRGRDDVTFTQTPVTLGSEDFGYLLRHIPGMMFWLGVGGEHPLHSTRFTPDDTVIPAAATLIADYLTQL